MSRGGNINGVAHLQNQNYLVTKKLKSVVQRVKNGHKISNNSHNYYDENHDEIDSIKEIVIWVFNDTQHQNNAPPTTVL